MGLIDDLGSGRVAVDTAAIIYFVERNEKFAPVLIPLFREADEGRREIVTSATSLMEVLVVPLRIGNRALANRYEALLTRSRGLRMIDLTREVLHAAAEIRAATGARTPDALQLAVAVRAGCAALMTNDRRFPAPPGLRIVQLSAYA